MSNGLLLLPVLLPILFWGFYHYHKDRHLPEPAGYLLLAFGLGLVSAGISRALYVALGWASLRYDALALADGNTLGLFAYSMLAIGPVEEHLRIVRGSWLCGSGERHVSRVPDISRGCGARLCRASRPHPVRIHLGVHHRLCPHQGRVRACTAFTTLSCCSNR
jgi:hypothetical protein